MEPGATAKRLQRVVLLGVLWVAGAIGCAQPRVAEVYPHVTEYEGREINELSFVDPAPFTEDSLEALTATHATRCSLLGFLPFCFPGTDWGRSVGRVQLRTIGEDLSRLEALYRRNGYFGTRVVPDIEEVGDDPGVHVRFVIERGDPIILDSVVVEGTEGIADPDSLEAELPLQAGELFDLADFAASADTVRQALLARGHAYAEVLRNYGVDTIQDRANVRFVAIPGPRVVVDTVLVDGLGELARRDVMRQATFDEGDLLRLSELRETQRNLYDLELVQFASVAVAADSLQRVPEDSTTATVRVAIAEGAEHVIEANAGFGTVECLRARARWTDRSVFGGGRKLTLTGSVSRIGAAGPVGGLGGSVCSPADEVIATGLDYRLAADFTQPYFRSPRNQLGATLFSERQSEPTLFQRTAHGLRLVGTHRFRPREYLTASVETEFRRMVATPILYCAGFQACGPEEVERFAAGRWRNALSADWVADRGNRPVNPTSGYTLRASSTWSSPLLASDYDFLRGETEGSIYRPAGRGWVLAGSARIGTFLTRALIGPTDFVPPEERFFAGGASSVRGYGRFMLGPGVYLVDNLDIEPETLETDPLPDSLAVDFFPTGGTSVAVVSTEARFPSPILRDHLRMVAFVDAGTIGRAPLWELNSQWRVTPGFGFRIQTPVGPIRVDMGYNPYPRPRASLYATDPATDELVRIDEDYRAPDPAFLRRFTLHIAVGQAF